MQKCLLLSRYARNHLSKKANGKITQFFAKGPLRWSTARFVSRFGAHLPIHGTWREFACQRRSVMETLVMFVLSVAVLMGLLTVLLGTAWKV
jgi:hypothetical protein